MAAHLNLFHLRRHALKSHFMVGVDRPAQAPAASGRLLDPIARPRLLAAWRPDAGGRLVCGWSLDTGDPV